MAVKFVSQVNGLPQVRKQFLLFNRAQQVSNLLLQLQYQQQMAAPIAVLASGMGLDPRRAVRAKNAEQVSSLPFLLQHRTLMVAQTVN